jgi:chromosome partitioning protein
LPCRSLSREAVKGEWNGYGIDMLESTVGNRVAFAKALTDGVSVYKFFDGQAKAEIDLLVDGLEAKGWL